MLWYYGVMLIPLCVVTVLVLVLVAEVLVLEASVLVLVLEATVLETSQHPWGLAVTVATV